MDKKRSSSRKEKKKKKKTKVAEEKIISRRKKSLSRRFLVTYTSWSGKGDTLLAVSSVRLQVSDYSQLSDHTVRLRLYKISSEKVKQFTNHICENCNVYD